MDLKQKQSRTDWGEVEADREDNPPPRLKRHLNGKASPAAICLDAAVEQQHVEVVHNGAGSLRQEVYKSKAHCSFPLGQGLWVLPRGEGYQNAGMCRTFQDSLKNGAERFHSKIVTSE